MVNETTEARWHEVRAQLERLEAAQAQMGRDQETLASTLGDLAEVVADLQARVDALTRRPNGGSG